MVRKTHNHTNTKEFYEKCEINYKEFLEENFIRIGGEGRDLNEAFGMDASKWKCKKTGNSPIIINYYYQDCTDWQLDGGCGHERKAIICGDSYFVEEFNESLGPKYYGPFNL